MSNKNIKISGLSVTSVGDMERVQKNIEVGFYVKFSRLANLFPESVKSVDTAKVGISVEQRDQLRSKSLAMRDVVDPSKLGLTKDTLDNYDRDMISEKDMDVIAKLAEEVVANEKALEGLENLVELFYEIIQTLPPYTEHEVLIDSFVSAATRFIFLARAYSGNLKSHSVEVRSAAITDIFESGSDFYTFFKWLDNFYYSSVRYFIF